MQSRSGRGNEDALLLHLASELPSSRQDMGAAIMEALKVSGYAYLRSSIPIEEYEALAGTIGAVLSRSDIKIDPEREMVQEQSRIVKGRPGRYRPDPLGFHTDNVRVDVLAMYCVEQDATDGAILLLDLGDVAGHFSPAEMAVLGRIELWAPDLERSDKQESFWHLAPLLSKHKDRYRIYYIPWLFRDSYDSDASEMIKKFSDYVRRKEEAQLVTLPVRKNESVFIDNRRMLHGRRAIPEDSKRHMVRLYIRARGSSAEDPAGEAFIY